MKSKKSTSRVQKVHFLGGPHLPKIDSGQRPACSTDCIFSIRDPNHFTDLYKSVFYLEGDSDTGTRGTCLQIMYPTWVCKS